MVLLPVFYPLHCYIAMSVVTCLVTAFRDGSKFIDRGRDRGDFFRKKGGGRQNIYIFEVKKLVTLVGSLAYNCFHYCMLGGDWKRRQI